MYKKWPYDKCNWSLYECIVYISGKGEGLVTDTRDSGKSGGLWRNFAHLCTKWSGAVTLA